MVVKHQRVEIMACFPRSTGGSTHFKESVEGIDYGVITPLRFNVVLIVSYMTCIMKKACTQRTKI